MTQTPDPRRWRINWDRVVLVAFVALQTTVVIAMLAAVVAIATR